MRGNSHARFLEGKAVVIPLTYSTNHRVLNSGMDGDSDKAMRMMRWESIGMLPEVPLMRIAGEW